MAQARDIDPRAKKSDIPYQEWAVLLHPEFDPEFDALPADVQNELFAVLMLLRTKGPALGRPHVDTLKGSRHGNMKELRLQVHGAPWRFLFAFDPARAAIVLVGGDKTGDGRFYERMLRIAEKRLAQHLSQLQRNRKP